MIFRILIMIFDIMGAVFNLWQYRDTEYKGFFNPIRIVFDCMACDNHIHNYLLNRR